MMTAMGQLGLSEATRARAFLSSGLVVKVQSSLGERSTWSISTTLSCPAPKTPRNCACSPWTGAVEVVVADGTHDVRGNAKGHRFANPVGKVYERIYFVNV